MPRIGMRKDMVVAFIGVNGREGNRRDAMLSCDGCKTFFVPIHFYESDMNGLMEVLNLFHYDKCAAIKPHQLLEVIITRDQPVPRTRFIFDRERRTLTPLA